MVCVPQLNLKNDTELSWFLRKPQPLAEGGPQNPKSVTFHLHTGEKSQNPLVLCHLHHSITPSLHHSDPSQQPPDF